MTWEARVPSTTDETDGEGFTSPGDRAPKHVPRNCETCGQPFMARRWDVNKGQGRFCSRSCMARNRKPTYAGPRKPEEKLPTVQLGTLAIGDKFWIDNRPGSVVDKMLLFDAVRIRLGRRTDLWHRAVRVEPRP